MACFIGLQLIKLVQEHFGFNVDFFSFMDLLISIEFCEQEREKIQQEIFQWDYRLSNFFVKG